MNRHKAVRGGMRLLCALVDYLLLMLPVQLILLIWIGVNTLSADFLLRILFAVYGVLLIEYHQGATLGKMVGRLKVVDKAGGKPPILYAGLRELVRSMYLIPLAGWAAGLVSVVLLFTRGTTLHDMAGGTRVIFRWEKQPAKTPEEDCCEPGRTV